MIRYTCPLCNQPQEFPDEMGGEYLPCPKCERLISIPKTPKPVQEPSPQGSAEQVAPAARPRVTDVKIASVKISGMAITSLVTGVLGITVCLWLPLPVLLPLVAIVLGHISYTGISKQSNELSGRGLAIAGFTMGYIGLIAGISVIILLFSMSEPLAELEASVNELERMVK